jgi:hypothetical protein
MNVFLFPIESRRFSALFYFVINPVEIGGVTITARNVSGLSIIAFLAFSS